MAEGHDDDTPKVDAVIRVASEEVNFWKRIALRSLIGAFVTIAILAIVGAAALTIVLGRFDSQQELLQKQGDLSSASDCNRHIQAELNDIQGITSQAFLSNNRPYFDELQTYRQVLTNLQRNVDIGEKCPTIPPRPAPPPPTTP